MNDQTIPAEKAPLLCRIGLHKWSIWGDKFSFRGTQYAFEYQQKRCLRCGVIHERKI